MNVYIRQCNKAKYLAISPELGCSSIAVKVVVAQALGVYMFDRSAFLYRLMEEKHTRK